MVAGVVVVVLAGQRPFAQLDGFGVGSRDLPRPCHRLPREAPVAVRVAEQAEAPFRVRERLFVITETRVRPAEAELDEAAHPAAAGIGGERSREVRQRLGVPSGLEVEPAQVDQRLRDQFRVAELAGGREGGAVDLGGARPVADRAQHVPETQRHQALRPFVAEHRGGAHTDAAHLQRLVEPAEECQVRARDVGEQHRDPRQAVALRGPHVRGGVAELGVRPGPGVLRAAEVLLQPGAGGHPSTRVQIGAVWEERQERLPGVVGDPVEQPVHRLVPVLVPLGEVRGVRPEQVVAGVPVLAGRFDQVLGGEAGQQRARGVRFDVAQHGGGEHAEALHRQQPDPPEQQRLLRPQPPVGPVEHGAHRLLLVVRDAQHLPPLRPQFRHELRDREVRGGGDAPRRDPQRQRQPCARVDQFGDGGGLGRTLQHRADQLPRLLVAEQRQRDAHRSLADLQPHQVGPARHHHAAGAGGQQRAQLPGAVGVVEHDQHAPVGQQRPVQRGAGLLARRDPFRRDPESDEEVGQDVAGGDRSAGPVAAQVHVQGAVGEVPLGLPRPPEHQGRLAHPRGADHGGEHGDAGVERGGQPVEDSQVPGAADEAG